MRCDISRLCIFPNMNVNSNIEFGLKNLSNKEKNERVDYLLNLNLQQCKINIPTELSGGNNKSLHWQELWRHRPIYF